MRGPRERMVVSAALLIRERGAHATAISDVLEHSGAPRGSAYHYFPGGRTQLLCEAVDFAGDHVAAIIAEAESGPQLIDTLIDKYRGQLLDSDFRAGCPIVAVSVEAGEPEIADGIDRERAGELAVLATTALEGAIVLARVRRDLMPLDVVRRQVRELLLATPSYQRPIG